MRRDYFTLTVGGTDAPAEEPTITIEYEGPIEELEDQLEDDGERLEADEIDIAYRLRDELGDHAGDAEGVISITNRITGEYIFELNVSAGTVFEFVEATNEYENATDDCRRFRIVIEADGERLVEYEQSTLLVYGADGTLLRQHSLIPSGVEL